jgi:hypothetical protein
MALRAESGASNRRPPHQADEQFDEDDMNFKMSGLAFARVALTARSAFAEANLTSRSLNASSTTSLRS